ncbi:MAG: hypothetical protein ACRDZ7_17615 [Acidimicrobiia bacterium]
MPTTTEIRIETTPAVTRLICSWTADEGGRPVCQWELVRVPADEITVEAVA